MHSVINMKEKRKIILDKFYKQRYMEFIDAKTFDDEIKKYILNNEEYIRIYNSMAKHFIKKSGKYAFLNITEIQMLCPKSNALDLWLKKFCGENVFFNISKSKTTNDTLIRFFIDHKSKESAVLYMQGCLYDKVKLGDGLEHDVMCHFVPELVAKKNKIQGKSLEYKKRERRNKYVLF